MRSMGRQECNSGQTKKKLLFLVQRVAAIVASRAAAILFVFFKVFVLFFLHVFWVL